MKIFNIIIKDKLQAPETEALIEEYLNRDNTEKEKQKKKKTSIKGSIGNMKLLYNTIDKALNLLKSSGYYTNWEKNESANELTVTIKVVKIK